MKIAELVIAATIAIVTLFEQQLDARFSSHAWFRWSRKGFTVFLLVLLLFLKEIFAALAPEPATHQDIQYINSRLDKIDRNTSLPADLMVDSLKEWAKGIYQDSLIALRSALGARDRKILDLALIKIEKGDLRGAGSLLEILSASELKEKSVPTIYSILGANYGGLGVLDSARIWIDRSLRLDSSNSYVWTNRGVILDALGHPDAALTAFDQAITLDSTNSFAWINRGLLYESLKNDSAALRDYSTTLQLSTLERQAWNNRGSVRARLGDREGALHDFAEAVRADTTYALGWYNLGTLILEKGRNPDSAVAALEKSVRYESTKSGAWYNLGFAYFSMRRLTDAIKAFDYAARLNPKFAAAWDMKGIVLRQMDRFDESLSSFDRAIASDSNFCNAWANKGLTLYMVGQNEMALQTCRAALACDSSLAGVWQNMAVIWYYGIRNSDSAIACNTRSLEIDPNFVIAKQFRDKVLLSNTRTP